MFYIDNILY
jgi:hypothetical protein